MRSTTLLVGLVSLVMPSILLAAEAWKSHRPMRVVPAVSNRVLPAELLLVVDATKGDDNNAGIQAAPLRTVQVAINRATPGTTITLRGGVYFERSSVVIVVFSSSRVMFCFAKCARHFAHGLVAGNGSPVP